MRGLEYTWIRHGGRTKDITPLLCVKNLSVRVGIREVLKDVELTVYPGDHVLITGPNGSGKSTLLNAIAGIDPARIESGSIEFNGVELTKKAPHERSVLGIAYMRQYDNVFPSLSVAENLKLALGMNGTELFAQTYPDWLKDMDLKKEAGNLSGGQKKKLAWGMTVLRKDVKLALLDEPKAGMDDVRDTMNNFQEEMTILDIEHT